MIEKATLEKTEEAEARTRVMPSGLTDNQITDKIIGAAIEVHRHLGPGLLEAAYEECLCYELSHMGLRFQRQVHLPIYYKGIKLECAHRMDLIVEDAVVVEIKATEAVAPIHFAQLRTYLKSSDKRLGLLINFNVSMLKDGLKRVVNGYTGAPLTERNSAPSALESEEGDASPSPSFAPRLRVSASRNISAVKRTLL